MAEQTEKAFLKQPKVFLSSKKTSKGKRPGKGGNRFWKSIGLGFKTPREAIEGTYIDKKCPFTGTVSVSGRILAGSCHSAKMMRTIIVREEAFKQSCSHFSMLPCEGRGSCHYWSMQAIVKNCEVQCFESDSCWVFRWWEESFHWNVRA
ncbi:40S ribosomal S11 [Gossypium arboreum]|uniref:40S ribosomal S11 n=1 Tax=Gossypium arboreum TaxID=29729 RepID=A0A0B0PAY9_GOSAR|nr:40S ribosomal S11 [Gossypium arboreum]